MITDKVIENCSADAMICHCPQKIEGPVQTCLVSSRYDGRYVMRFVKRIN